MGLQRQWAPAQSIPDHRPDNGSSYSRASVTLASLSPSGTTKRYSIGGTWPVSIRQPPAPVNHTKSTLNLSKSSNLLCAHSIQPRGLRASPHFQLGCSLKGPPAETLEPNTFCPHIQHSSFCASFRVRSSVLSFTLMICLITNHTLSLEHTFPNLAPPSDLSPSNPLGCLINPAAMSCSANYSPAPRTGGSPAWWCSQTPQHTSQALYTQTSSTLSSVRFLGPLMISKHICHSPSFTHSLPGPAVSPTTCQNPVLH